MSKRRQRQRGQGMVEYTVVTSLGILVLLGPGVDVISWTMETIKGNYQGYSYAMSLSQWPEFNLESGAEPLVLSDADVSLASDETARMAHTGTRGGGALPTYVAPDTDFTDFSQLAYRAWIVAQESEERAEELAGPNMEEHVNRLTAVFEDALNLVSYLDLATIKSNLDDKLPPNIDDIVDIMPTRAEIIEIVAEMVAEHFSPI